VADAAAVSRALSDDRAVDGLEAPSASAGILEAFARAFEHAPVGIVVRNLEGRAVWVNDELCRMLGYQREEFVATPIPQFVHPADLPALSDQAEKLIRGDVASCRVGCRYLHKDGATVHAQVQLSAVRTEDGRLEAIVSQIQDVTPQKLAEAKLMQRVDFERIVTALATDFINLPTDRIDEGVRLALEEVAHFAGADRAGVFVIRPAAGSVDLSHEWKKANLAPHGPLLQNIPVERFGWLVSELERGEPVRIDDLVAVASAANDEAQAWLIAEGIASLVVVPLVHDDGLTGFVGFAGAAPVATDAESVALLRIVAEMLDNVLDRKATEEALRESGERFRQMADNVHQLFWIAELDPPRIIYASPAFEKIWNVSRSSLEGDPQKFHQMVVAEDVDAVLAFYLDALGGPRELEYRIQLADGSIRWLRARAFPVRNDAGDVYRIAGVADDITEAKRAAEEIAHRTELERLIRDLATEFINLPVTEVDDGIEAALRKLGEFASVDVSYIVLIGDDGNSLDTAYTWISPGCGVDRADFEGLSLDGFPWYRERLARREFVYRPNVSDFDESARLEREACESRDIQSVISVPMVRGASGSGGDAVVGILGFNSIRAPKRWSEDVITLLKIAGGMFVSALERKRAEDTARRHEAELAHALRLGTMGELAAGLAHELNQPLSAISSFASGCERRLRAGNVEVPELLKAVEEMSRQALRAGEVIRTLRAHVRRRAPRREWCEVNLLVEGALMLVRGDLVDSRITLRCELGDDLPPVQVDSIQIEQVLLNLIRNGVDAITAVPSGKRELVVSTRRLGDQEIEVAVVDSGRGIAADRCDAIFDPFVTTKRHGLGLGLSISRSIISGHGGRLWAAPAPGAGAAFTFTLPLSQPEGRDGRGADGIHR
jgi:PAS domain S-box-containing protein